MAAFPLLTDPDDQERPLRFNQNEENLISLHWFKMNKRDNSNVEMPQDITNVILQYCMDSRVVFWRKYCGDDGRKILFEDSKSWSWIKKLSLCSNGTYEYQYEVVGSGFDMSMHTFDKHSGAWIIQFEENEMESKLVLIGTGYQDTDPRKGIRPCYTNVSVEMKISDPIFELSYANPILILS
eukprot:148890_1